MGSLMSNKHDLNLFTALTFFFSHLLFQPCVLVLKSQVHILQTWQASLGGAHWVMSRMLGHYGSNNTQKHNKKSHNGRYWKQLKIVFVCRFNVHFIITFKPYDFIWRDHALYSHNCEIVYLEIGDELNE